ncbi:MAG: 7-carboxy-7-deazaguanine synthase QueE [Chromatiales bacterium]|jgi:7-carboxy-7-deazaguanine synthase
MPQLRVTEIFLSLQGESRSVGVPTVFVRLTGCPLRCGYCDTEYAFRGGTWMEQAEVLERVRGFGVSHVTVTGGEPLAQNTSPALITALCDGGYRVSVETSGALDVSVIDPRAVKVMDLKTPASGEMAKNLCGNLDHLAPADEVKLVICDRADYEWARALVREQCLAERCEVLFSPCHGRQDPRVLAEWILEDRLPVRFQIQLHKLLWGDTPGH